MLLNIKGGFVHCAIMFIMQIVTPQGNANQCPILDDGSLEVSKIGIGVYYQISILLLMEGKSTCLCLSEITIEQLLKASQTF